MNGHATCTHDSRERGADIIVFPPHTDHHHLIPVTAQPARPVDRSTIHAQTLTTLPLAARSTRTIGERVRPWLTALAVLTCTAAAAAVVWLICLAVMAVITFVAAVITWISAHLLLIIIVTAGLLFFGGTSAACTGIHCGGCRR
jgi:hypothetical protein